MEIKTPVPSDLDIAQVLAKFLTDGHQVGKRLAGVVYITLHVEHGHTGPFGHLTHIRLSFPRYGVVTYRDTVPVTGQNNSHVLGAFTMGNL